jgi:hypothetical protein
MRSAEYWIKAINEAESDDEVLRLFFVAQEEAPTEDARRKLAIAIHKVVKPRLMVAIKSFNEKRNNGV